MPVSQEQSGSHVSFVSEQGCLPGPKEISNGHGEEVIEIIDLEVIGKEEGSGEEGRGGEPGWSSSGDLQGHVERRDECLGRGGPEADRRLHAGDGLSSSPGDGEEGDLRYADPGSVGSGGSTDATSLIVPDKPKFTEIFPAWMVEGMLAEILSEVKSAVDVMWDNVADPDHHAKITFVIIWSYVQDGIVKLKPYSDASLRPKHAMCRRVLRSMEERMEDNNPNDDGDEFDLSIFAQDVVSFLTAFHVCLSEKKTREAKSVTLKEFCSG